jgi:asparagine synthase (glutamine-hydrolysing)
MHFGPYVLVFNGEVYNFREIRRELEARGDRFKSDTDTEVILHAYGTWGRECLQRFNGMFAFAIYDQVKQELFLARDRLGVKPLYYTRRGGAWAFASEIRALLPVLDRRAIDARALVDYLTYRYVPDDRTIFEGIHRLPPAHTLTIRLDTNEGTFERYWWLRYESNTNTLDDNAAQVRELLRQAVQRRMVSDVPLGAYLSGGLDSSAVVAMMADAGDRRVKTFTVTFGDDGLSEARYASEVATRFDTEHTEIDVSAEAVDVLPRVARHLGEPVGDAATIPLFLMAEATKKHATVVLSGEGSDELFAGYSKYAWLHASRWLPNLPPLARRGLAGRISALFMRDAARRFVPFVTVFDDHALKRLLAFPLADATRFDPSPLLTTGDTLHDLLHWDTHTWLPNDLLEKGDTMTMAHAVEARFPFLDHTLVEFAATIPAAQKLAWGKDKIVYRRAVAPWLPASIVARKKQGFTVPLQRWLDHGLRDYAIDLADRIEVPLLERSEVKRIMAHRPRTVFGRRQFWTLLFLLTWYREVFRA